VVLGVGVFTIIRGRKESVVARTQQEAEQAGLEKLRAVEVEKARQQRAQAEQEAADKARFGEVVKTLRNIPGLRNAAGRGYIRGKMVLIDKDEGGVDAISNVISNDRMTRRASEIGTVVWIKHGKVPATRPLIYGASQEQTYYYTYTVTVIDMTTKTIVASRFFKSDEPDANPDGSGRYEIAYYLLDLPRR
jgi:hypothetical protein